jgi:hypothetical protein
MTIKFPDDLTQVAKLLQYTTWPHLDEDLIHTHAKEWLGSANDFKRIVDYPAAAQADTIFDPNSDWSRGHDMPLDTFMDFWRNNPEANYHAAAAQAPAIAGALNNVAGIVVSHKVAAINALQNAKDTLSQQYHLLGDSENSFFGFFGTHGTETLATESADRRKQDETTITVTSGYLQKLTGDTQQALDNQLKIIDKARDAFDGISSSVTKLSGDLLFQKDNPVNLPPPATNLKSWLAGY